MMTQHETYLDAASDIGRVFVRDALWAGDQCTWLTQSIGANDYDSRSMLTTCGADMATGARGINRFLSQLIAIRPDPLAADVLDGVRRQLSSVRDPSTAQEDSDSLHAIWAERIKTGHPDVKYNSQLQSMFAEFCRGTFSHQAHSPVRLAEFMIQQFAIHAEQHICFIDPLCADVLLTIATATSDAAWMEAAGRIADHVLAQTNRFDQPWHDRRPREVAPWGLADGLSGVGHFLLRIADPSIPPLLLGAKKTPL